jgi:hypothetical protein
MAKLDIHNSAGLIRYAIQNKVVSILPTLENAEKSSVRRLPRAARNSGE